MKEETKQEIYHEQILEKRKNKLKNFFFGWVEDNYDKVFIGVLIFAIIIRLYYFWITKSQPLWYDEAEYLSMAKDYAGLVINEHNPGQRLPGFPLYASIFFMIGITNEVVLRFILNFIPSIIVLIVFYFLIRQMYKDKRIALISTMIFSVLWEHLFYSNRFHTENYALIFQFLTMFILFKVYMKKENFSFVKVKYSLIWIFIFCILSVLFRPGNLFFVPVVFLFILLLNQSVISNRVKKSYILYGCLGLLVFSYFFTTYLLPKIPLLWTYYHPQWKIAWHTWSVFLGFYGSVLNNIPPTLYYLFLGGLIIVLGKFALLIDKIWGIKRNSENLEYKSNLFNLLLLFFVLFVFIFLIRNEIFEYRWFFTFLPAMLPFTSIGVIFIGDCLGNILNNKKIAMFVIVLILSFGIYNQVVHADQITKIKLDSYSQVRDAGYWIKENSSPSDVVISASITQNTYYSERRTLTFSHKEFGKGYLNEDEFIERTKLEIPKYLIVSIYEPSVPEWSFSFPEKYKENLEPVKIYEMNGNPSLIIYEFKSYEFEEILNGEINLEEIQ